MAKKKVSSLPKAEQPVLEVNLTWELTSQNTPERKSKSDVGFWSLWKTTCGTYTISVYHPQATVVPTEIKTQKWNPERRGYEFCCLEKDRGNYPINFNSVAAAVDAVEKYHAERIGEPVSSLNRDELFAAVKAFGINPFGYDKNGEEKPKKTPKKKKEKEPGSTAPKPAAAKGGAGKDRFGCRLNTNTARLNACLSEEPKTDKQLVDEAGLQKSGYGWTHLERLVGEKKLIGEGVGKARTFKINPDFNFDG